MAKDESDNISSKEIKYYDVYQNNNINEENEIFKLNNIIINKDKETIMNINVALKKDLTNEKIKIIKPYIIFYDKSFNEYKPVIYLNNLDINENASNNYIMQVVKDLTLNSIINYNYRIINENEIKYFVFGFNTINDEGNTLSNSYFNSKYYIY